MHRPVHRLGTLSIGSLILVALPIVASCSEGDPLTPTPSVTPSAAFGLAADACRTVDLEITSALGLWMLDGRVVPGGTPVAVELAGVDGWLASVLKTPGAPLRGRSGTSHWELTHVFTTAAPSPVDVGGGRVVPALSLSSATDWFVTDDLAVCADAGRGPLVCRVNDRMPVADGAGRFADAAGRLHNHGWITITDPGSGAGVGEFHLRGRLCGDGI